MTKTMKPFLMIFVFIAGVFTTAKAQTKADDILGKWTNDDKTRVLEFVKNGSIYEAVIKEAPDNSLIGKKQITNLSFSNSSYKGTVHIPKKGKSFPCTVAIKSNGTMELTAKAGFMSKSQIWTRVK